MTRKNLHWLPLGCFIISIIITRTAGYEILSCLFVSLLSSSILFPFCTVRLNLPLTSLRTTFTFDMLVLLLLVRKREVTISSLLLQEGGGSGLPGTWFFFIPEKDTDEYTSCGHSKLLCWGNSLYSMCSAFLQKRVVLRFIHWVQVHQFCCITSRNKCLSNCSNNYKS